MEPIVSERLTISFLSQVKFLTDVQFINTSERETCSSYKAVDTITQPMAMTAEAATTFHLSVTPSLPEI